MQVYQANTSGLDTSDFVDILNDQEIEGVKTFVDTPVFQNPLEFTGFAADSSKTIVRSGNLFKSSSASIGLKTYRVGKLIHVTGEITGIQLGDSLTGDEAGIFTMATGIANIAFVADVSFSFGTPPPISKGVFIPYQGYISTSGSFIIQFMAINLATAVSEAVNYSIRFNTVLRIN
tara:strand:+ start:31721 stop:32248 length:528 start_codon:yes stop_codon:yes gene_type:complete